MRRKTKLGFSRYRTSNIARTIVEINQPSKCFPHDPQAGVWRVLHVRRFGLAFLKLTDNLTTRQERLINVDAIPSGFFGGLAFGIAELIRRSLGRMMQLLDVYWKRPSKSSEIQFDSAPETKERHWRKTRCAKRRSRELTKLQCQLCIR